MTHSDRDVLRRVRFAPYRKGMGPTFSLLMYATPHTDSRGQTRIGYVLKMHAGKRGTVLFSGEDFAGSPLHADDSDATVEALMGFLTLRPGDTDSEYFADYTPAQLAFCSNHAETLACEATSRFGTLD